MSSDGKGSTAVIGRWKVMVTNLRPQLEAMPQLAGRYTEMLKFTTDAEELENRQALLKADLQEVNRQRRDLAKTGEELRNRIAAFLRAEHGFSSERLLEFGLKPKRPRVRAKKSDDQPTTTPTPVTSAPATK